jgi:hypothetical protein
MSLTRKLNTRNNPATDTENIRIVNIIFQFIFKIYYRDKNILSLVKTI